MAREAERQMRFEWRPVREDSRREDDAARQTAALMGLIVVLALAIAGVILARELAKNAKLEDCLMSGRRNCAPIEVPVRP